MNNFIYKNPTAILFGKGEIANIDAQIAKDARILLLYGGGSIKRNGVYEQVVNALGQRYIVEQSGVPANPEYDVLMEAVEKVRSEKLNFILAVGGGSVIDGAKFIAAAAPFKGYDAWDIVSQKSEIESAIPFSTILTLPATGSEMNSGAVISRRSIKEKLSFGSPLLFPQFSVLDPQVISSLPQRQLVNGVIDAFVHTLEQYMTYTVDGRLQDRFSESLLQTLIEVSQKVVNDPTDYDAAANFMWACTWALNGWIAQGVPSDWGVHALGHELTALFGIDHARTLAIVAPRYYEYLIEVKKDKLAQMAERVWGIHADNQTMAANEAIQQIEQFFQSLGVATRLSAYTDQPEGTAQTIAQRFTERGWLGIGEQHNVAPKDVEKIILSTY